MSQPLFKHWALLGYLILVWGFAFALIAVALESFHPVFIVWCPSVDGCGGCVGRLALARARLDHGPGVVAETDPAQCHRQHYLPGFSLIAWAEQSVPSAEVGYPNGADAHCDPAAGALVTRA